MDAISEILLDARRQAQTLYERNESGALHFWRLIRSYAEAALHVAWQYRDLLETTPPEAVFSAPVLHHPRLRPLLAPYDVHHFLRSSAPGAGLDTEPLGGVRACDTLVEQIFLGSPEPGYWTYPGMLGYLEDPEEELAEIQAQEAFILRRLELSSRDAAERIRQLEEGLAQYLPHAAQKPTRGGPMSAPDPDLSMGDPTGPSGSTVGLGGRATPGAPKGGYGVPTEDVEVKSPAPPAPPAPSRRDDGHLYRVWYATTRQPVEEDAPRQGYGKKADSQGRVHHGYCDVLIPKSHRFGSVGSPAWKRWLRPWKADDRLRIEAYARLDEAIFLNAVRRELAARDLGERVALVYIHGFRTTFDQAAIRAAQIGCDLKVPGVTAFFSWHSRGEVDEYFADGEAIQEAEAPLRRFLLQFAREVDAEKVHLIAHSMGNQGLARVVQGIAKEVTAESGKPFAQILLAAPDISQSLFRQLAREYPKISERTTLYVSSKDKALGLSRWLQDTPRAGFTPPVTVVPDIDTVEVTDIDLTLLGHTYFAEAAAVLYDMKELIDDNKPPGRRARLREVAGPPPHWVIAR